MAVYPVRAAARLVHSSVGRTVHSRGQGLADEFDQLRAGFDALPDPGLGYVYAAAGATSLPVLEEADRLPAQRRELQAAWDKLVAQIRDEPGFKDFLTAPDIARLTSVANDGPIVN